MNMRSAVSSPPPGNHKYEVDSSDYRTRRCFSALQETHFSHYAQVQLPPVMKNIQFIASSLMLFVRLQISVSEYFPSYQLLTVGVSSRSSAEMKRIEVRESFKRRKQKVILRALRRRYLTVCFCEFPLAEL